MTNLEIKKEFSDFGDLKRVSSQVEKLKDEVLSMNTGKKWEVGEKGGNGKERNSVEKVKNTTDFLASVLRGQEEGKNAVQEGLYTLVKKKIISQEDTRIVENFFKKLQKNCVIDGKVNEREIKQIVSSTFDDKRFMIIELLKEAMPKPR